MHYLRKTVCLSLMFFLFLPASFVQAKERILVIYYSRTGNTKLVAEELAKEFGADIERLIDKRKRTGPIGFPSASKDAVAKNLTELEPLKVNPDQYDIIIIGTPSWYGNMTPAVRTFITENDLSKKFVAVFGTTNHTGIENTCKQVVELLSIEDYEAVPTLPLRKRDLKDEVLSKKIKEFYASVMEILKRR